MRYRLLPPFNGFGPIGVLGWVFFSGVILLMSLGGDGFEGILGMTWWASAGISWS